MARRGITEPRERLANSEIATQEFEGRGRQTLTVLALRGLPIGRDMDGSIMKELLAPDVRQALSPELIPTHLTSEWLAAQGCRARIENPHLEERLDQLRSLGYLD